MIEPRDYGSKGRKALNTYIIPRFSGLFKNGDRILNIGRHLIWDYGLFFNNPKLMCYYQNLDSDVKNIGSGDIHGNIESCPVIEGGSYHGIMMIGVFEFIDKHESAFEEIYRILKSDGKLLVAFPGIGTDYGSVTLTSWVDYLKKFRIDETYFYYDNDMDISSVCVICTKRQEK